MSEIHVILSQHDCRVHGVPVCVIFGIVGWIINVASIPCMLVYVSTFFFDMVVSHLWVACDFWYQNESVVCTTWYIFHCTSDIGKSISPRSVTDEMTGGPVNLFYWTMFKITKIRWRSGKSPKVFPMSGTSVSTSPILPGPLYMDEL